jgi:hypothetical protein
MKNLKDLTGIKFLTSQQQQEIKGGRSPINCYVKCPVGHLCIDHYCYVDPNDPK